jgi:hypothetical protein
VEIAVDDTQAVRFQVRRRYRLALRAQLSNAR